MAGIGSAPKDPSVRRNTTSPQRGEWIDITTERVPDEDVVLPPLPVRIRQLKDGIEPHPWSPQAIRSWEAWGRDPVSVYWTEGDIAMACDTIDLVDVNPIRNASEIRQRMTALGLSPAGKRNLRFRVKPSIEVGQTATKDKPVTDELDERRNRLAHGA